MDCDANGADAIETRPNPQSRRILRKNRRGAAALVGALGRSWAIMDGRRLETSGSSPAPKNRSAVSGMRPRAVGGIEPRSVPQLPTILRENKRPGRSWASMVGASLAVPRNTETRTRNTETRTARHGNTDRGLAQKHGNTDHETRKHEPRDTETRTTDWLKAVQSVFNLNIVAVTLATNSP